MRKPSSSFRREGLVRFQFSSKLHGTHVIGGNSYDFSLLLSTGLYSPLGLRATVCENDTLTVSCDDQLIQIINAHYGRLNATTCAANIGTPDTECLVSGTRDVVVSGSVTDVYCSVV